MKIIKQTYLGQHKHPDGRLIDVFQNVWDDRPIEFARSWQDAEGYWHAEMPAAYCPRIDIPSKRRGVEQQ